MSQQYTKSPSLARNTIVLYIRMIFTMLISLYTSRIILNALGVVDYGVYNAVAGFVSMFAIVTNSLTSAISRFLTFDLGTGNYTKLRNTFSSAVIIEILISIFVVVIAESIGLWFLNNKMQIPDEREFAAHCIYQISIFTFVINLISVPYNACVVAHEKMTTFAFVGILKSMLILVACLWVKHYNADRLILYAVLLFIISLIERIIYGIYCSRRFPECKFIFSFDGGIFRNLLTFAGWNFFGTGSGVLRDQGANLLINVFCGPAVNAARGIAMQVSGAVSQFSTNFTTAINPQITKCYASGDIFKTNELVYKGAKLTYYLLMLLAIPVIYEAPYLLKIWLDIVPEYSIVFIRLILIYLLVESISYTMVTLMLATGEIKHYQIAVGVCQMMNFPISYILLKLGYSPISTIVCNIVIAIACLLVRLLMLKIKVNFSISRFLKDVICPIITVSILTSLVPHYITSSFSPSFVRLCSTVIFSIIIAVIWITIIGITKSERKLLIDRLKNIRL